MTETAHERIRVDAPADRCWDVAVDFESYPEWADVKEARILEHDPEGRGKRVEYRVAALGKSVRYVLEYDYAEAPTAFSWKLVEAETPEPTTDDGDSRIVLNLQPIWISAQPQ